MDVAGITLQDVRNRCQDVQKSSIHARTASGACDGNMRGLLLAVCVVCMQCVICCMCIIQCCALCVLHM